jgi:hypothetical protein
VKTAIAEDGGRFEKFPRAQRSYDAYQPERRPDRFPRASPYPSANVRRNDNRKKLHLRRIAGNPLRRLGRDGPDVE